MHRIVGLDVAGDVVRAVVLQSGFRGFSVLAAAAVPLPAAETWSQRLALALAQLPLSPPLSAEDTVATALPGAQVAGHSLSLPFIDPRRIAQVLPAEVEGAIPFDLEEVVWDHTVLQQAGGKSQVLVGVVKKTALRDHLATLAAAGVDPRIATFAPIALGALGERQMLAGGAQPASGAGPDGAPAGADPLARAQDDGPTELAASAASAGGLLPPPPPLVAILEAGPERGSLCLLQDGKAVLVRSLPSANAAAWAAAAVDPAARAKVLVPLLRDLRISLRAQLAAGQGPAQLLLAGTLASLPGAVEQLGTELQMPTATLALGPAAGLPPDANGAELALAFALALRAQQPRGHLNFRKGEFAVQRDVSRARGQVGRLAIGVAALLVLALVLGIVRVRTVSAQVREYDEAFCTATRRILGNCITDSRLAVAALQGGKSKAAGIPRVSAAEVLAEVVANLPNDAPPTLDDSEISTTRVRLRGVAESFSRIDEIIAALRKDKCFGEIKKTSDRQSGSQKIVFSLDFAYTCSGETPGGA